MKFFNLSKKALFMVLTFKPKLNLKIMLKGSKTKIMKGRKNRRGLTHVKATFLHTNKKF